MRKLVYILRRVWRWWFGYAKRDWIVLEKRRDV